MKFRRIQLQILHRALQDALRCMEDNEHPPLHVRRLRARRWREYTKVLNLIEQEIKATSEWTANV